MATSTRYCKIGDEVTDAELGYLTKERRNDF